MDKQKGTFTAKQINIILDRTKSNVTKTYYFPKEKTGFNDDTYFLPLICLRWWKTLMTSRTRLGASSILEAKLMQAIATICQDN